jgi:hypothetical protein
MGSPVAEWLLPPAAPSDFCQYAVQQTSSDGLHGVRRDGLPALRTAPSGQGVRATIALGQRSRTTSARSV